MCQTIVLSRKGSTVISQCVDCKTITCWLQQLLVNFTPEQFSSFKAFTANLEISESLFPFPDGEERLVLRTPHSDICMTFSIAEWEKFSDGNGRGRAHANGLPIDSPVVLSNLIKSSNEPLCLL